MSLGIAGRSIAGPPTRKVWPRRRRAKDDESFGSSSTAPTPAQLRNVWRSKARAAKNAQASCRMAEERLAQPPQYVRTVLEEMQIHGVEQAPVNSCAAIEEGEVVPSPDVRGSPTQDAHCEIPGFGPIASRWRTRRAASAPEVGAAAQEPAACQSGPQGSSPTVRNVAMGRGKGRGEPCE